MLLDTDQAVVASLVSSCHFSVHRTTVCLGCFFHRLEAKKTIIVTALIEVVNSAFCSSMICSFLQDTFTKFFVVVFFPISVSVHSRQFSIIL